MWIRQILKNTQKCQEVPNFPTLPTSGQDNYLRAQKELGAKSGIYDCVLGPKFHVNKFLERSEVFFLTKTKIIKKVPNLEISVRSLWGGS